MKDPNQALATIVMDGNPAQVVRKARVKAAPKRKPPLLLLLARITRYRARLTHILIECDQHFDHPELADATTTITRIKQFAQGERDQ